MSFILLYLTFVTSAFTQMADTSETDTTVHLEGAIKATAEIAKKHIPQNRTLSYTVRVSWNGDLERYEVVTIEEPALTNLEIVSTSTSDWVGVVDGVRRAVKEYEFVLRPQELGMAYIEDTRIAYKDRISEETRQLTTNRLEIEVGEPIIEKDNAFIVWVGLGALLFITGGVTAVTFVRRRKQREAERQLKVQDSVPLEEKYLSNLKTEVDLQDSDKQSAFSNLSKLFKKYLSERYDISAMELTTKEIAGQLNNMAVSEKIIEQTEEILNACDVAKFSGGQLEHGTLERVYTLLEDILNQNQSYYIDHPQN